MHEAQTSTARRVGERIRAMRVKRGLTLDALAEKAELDKSRLSKIERGESETSLDRYECIARALGVSLSEVMD